jgi:predicted transcriptional regulator
MKKSITVRLDSAQGQRLERCARETGRTKSEIVRAALRRQYGHSRFEQLRERVLPFAEARGYLVDEDVFRDIS